MDTFTFDGKALSAVEAAEGDLLLEGFSVIFAGLDRQMENFAPGAFRRACKAFLEGPAPLCFHHKPHLVLGKVLEMEEVPNVGVRVKARVDGAIKDSPELAHLYAQIKKGTLTGLSWGGFFRRAGSKIVDIDATELSVTATPTHSQPSFAVVEGKALEAALLLHEANNLRWLRDELQHRRDLDRLRVQVARMNLGIPSTWRASI
jgi:HK97 family phage prohead protease